jgi:hypothetical protein
MIKGEKYLVFVKKRWHLAELIAISHEIGVIWYLFSYDREFTMGREWISEPYIPSRVKYRKDAFIIDL